MTLPPEIALVLTPVVVEPPMEPILTATIHKTFMSAKPPHFNGRGESDKVEEWLREIEKAFRIVEVPEKEKYENY